MTLRPHVVAVVALPGVVAFDLTMPCEVFGRAEVPGGARPYEVRVCGETRSVDAGAFQLALRWGLADLARAHTVIVPGVMDPTRPSSPAVLEALRAAARRRARIASICSGAFVLAEAGLLDGLRVTTHWVAAGLLARRYPTLTVDPNVLFVDNGRILTSAGGAAGMDLCLHMLRSDHGAAVAAHASRLAVVPLERSGGQAQYIVHEPPTSTSSLAPLLDWMNRHLRDELTLPTLARRARMSTRTLSRRFREQTGTTPLKWVLTARIARAQQLLESTSLSLEEIAGDVGFAAASTLRNRFAQVMGASPMTYRKLFRREGEARAQH
ncbi:helix-turn-helix domain-containing protein [Nannocystis pusilla]|uniref:Helix-turn-helix domain-containing protein n=1 Tax=Nannocystis pusilla TaxID=889268 RepID=A0A9X3EMM9_9BACT|nr:helix-turn-helix domain-containing protein [Nannocystis pusilla]MCY1006818.1 helix-turn-helix domain-containing protein [Nannocystis pusilla]